MNRYDPHEGSDQAVNPMDDFVSGHEYTDLTNKIRNFDQSREATYGQVAHVMLGGGGNSLFEAQERLETLTIKTAQDFSAAALEILSQTPDTDEAKVMITNLYTTDEIERLEILASLNPEGEYTPTSSEELYEGLDEALEEYSEEHYAQIFERLYGRGFAIDVNECLEAAPANTIESETVHQYVKNEALKRAAYDVAKMAGAALIAIALTRRRAK